MAKKLTVLITGGSSGIGLSLAEQFALHGHEIIIASSSPEKLEKAKTELVANYFADVTCIAVDLAKPDGADKLYGEVKASGKEIDVLVNNAGFGDYAELVEADIEKQERMINLNITALVKLCRLYGKEMKDAGKGKILNIASCAAFSGGPYMSVYYATKAFVLSFSEAIGEELREYGVTVTALCLGPTSTGFTQASNMAKCTMFKKIKPDTPDAVAKTGYRALMNGRTVKYHGIPTKLMAFASRLTPRIINRKFAKNINSKPE